MSPEPTYLYLTTTGRVSGRPRRIEIWFTQQQRRFYLIAEHGLRSQWVQNLLADPAVRFRVGTRSGRGRARVVDRRAEPALARAIRRRSEAKYGWGDGLVVEIEPAPRAAARRPRRRRAGG